MKASLVYILIAWSAVLLACHRHANEYDATGMFEADEVIVSAETEGRILSIYATEGTQLKAGDRIALIDTTQLHLTKLQLTAGQKAVRSGQLNVNSQLAATQEQLNKALREKQRTENLLAANAATQKQVDDINANIHVLQKQIEAQSSRMQSANAGIRQQSTAYDAQLAQVEERLANSLLTSPIEGTMIAQYAQPGELANPGRPICKIADTKHMYLRAYITSDQLTDLKVGQKVTVRTHTGADKEREYDGTIRWVSDKSEFTPKNIQTRNERANLVYAVKVDVRNDGFLKIGMYGEMKKQ